MNKNATERANAIIGEYFWLTKTPDTGMIERERGVLRDAIAAALAAAHAAGFAEGQRVERERLAKFFEVGVSGNWSADEVATAIREHWDPHDNV